MRKVMPLGEIKIKQRSNMRLYRKLFSAYHVDCMDEEGRRFIKIVKKNPVTGKETYSPRIYYNPDGSTTVRDDKTGEIIKEYPAKKGK